ncbi:hypothetical protein GMC23_12035 [Turicibacter sanguinis]|uniref:hypothetical protein n=1 Tax=Turicibacter sanguinis TaxID=154288 RepID=UPI0012BD3B59|nr:hypothetical protein [Turicibacter sanguinis]MCU7195924.1 hypothetical protein [Turicibacter sanguinis]MTO25318.1 hypothetical protein [Turicibacter sanguinis]MTO27666.1 hypothetical protein [Turicibacter sanguinis]MTO90607.1 hypothetical protein [Turicibacter sanguinis]MTP70726.1 hypothetical protein [Turicibacter sanguinis]
MELETSFIETEIKQLWEYNNENIKVLVEYLQEAKAKKEPEHVIDCFTALINFYAINKEYIETIHSLQIDQLEASKQKLHLSHRVVIQTSSLFYSVISQIEYEMKKIIKEVEFHPLADCQFDKNKMLCEEFNKVYNDLDPDSQQKLKKVRKTIKRLPKSDSLRSILDYSKSRNLITESDYSMWLFILEVRNISVHNNRIGNKNMQIDINHHNYKIEKDKMLYGPLKFYLVMSNQAIVLFNNWYKSTRK